MEMSDEEVAERVQRGETDALGILIDRYEAKLKRYAKKFLLFEDDATDMVQDVFIKIYTNIQSFDSSKRFSPWIYRIAHNAYINEIKRRGKAPVSFFDPDTIFPHPVAEEKTDSVAQENELKKMMQHSLTQLSIKYREPLVLHFYEDMSYKDISEVLRIPTSTVGVRIKRGKEKLEALYRKTIREYE
jgi:RNA polymerase sigma-70 factor (ECF subfamily)